MKNKYRLCIYPKEAAAILGRTEKYTYKIFQCIPLFADYTGLPEDEIRKLLR